MNAELLQKKMYLTLLNELYPKNEHGFREGYDSQDVYCDEEITL